MRKVYLLICVLLCFGATTVNAQWYKLKPYINPFPSNDSDYTYYPEDPLVAGNGAIVYEGFGYPNGGILGDAAIGESNNDLYSSAGKYEMSSLNGLAALVSKNDSSYGFINYYGFISPTPGYLYYTSNNFNTVYTIDSINFPNTVLPVALSFSPNLIYLAWEFFSNPDTIFIDRCSITPPITKHYINVKYKNPSNLYFTSDSTGFMLCIYANNSAKSVLTKTSDSGAIWVDSFLDSLNLITGCSFPTQNIGYLTENNGNIYKTINGGDTWVQILSPTITPLNCVSFSNPLLGYIAGNSGELYKTVNGGSSWTAEISNDIDDISSLYTFDTVAYFIDANNSICKNEIPTGSMTIETPASAVKVFPNPANGIFNIQITNSNLPIANSHIEVYNMLGEKVYSNPFTNSQLTINLSSQPNGIYLYRVIIQDGSLVGEGKLVIQK